MPPTAGCESAGWILVEFEQNISRVAVAGARKASQLAQVAKLSGKLHEFSSSVRAARSGELSEQIQVAPFTCQLNQLTDRITVAGQRPIAQLEFVHDSQSACPASTGRRGARTCPLTPDLQSALGQFVGVDDVDLCDVLREVR